MYWQQPLLISSSLIFGEANTVQIVSFMRKPWWKILAALLLIYTVVGGLLMSVPRLAIINESIRALYFHVPMWFGMVVLFLVSLFYAIKYLRSHNPDFDVASV